MTDATGAVFVDLDRTLIRSASGPVLQAAMVAEGVLPAGRSLPGERYLYGFYNTFGETAAFMSLARGAARLMKGRSAEAVRAAGQAAVEELIDLVQPWALEELGVHRAEGRLIVLATTSPLDLVTPLARALDFDDVIGTRYEEVEGTYTGRLIGKFAWGRGKRDKVRDWCAANAVDLADCHAYSDSMYDVPLLSSVGHPHPLNADPRLVAVALARRWPLENWDRPPGVPNVVGLEPYHLLRPFVRPESFPYAGSPCTASSTSRPRARWCSCPTTAATSTWRHWHWWPPASAARSASWANRSCSTPPRSASWPGPSAGSPSTATPRPASRWPGPTPPCGPARRCSSYPRAPSPGARPSSTRC